MRGGEVTYPFLGIFRDRLFVISDMWTDEIVILIGRFAPKELIAQLILPRILSIQLFTL